MNLSAIPFMLGMIPRVLKGVMPSDVEQIKAITCAAYPNVRQTSTRTLAQWMDDQPGSLLLVDVRSAREFQVSHLKGALNLDSRARILEWIQKTKAARTVLYCSVGYRSSRLAETLQREVDGELFNLEGSIFQWANEGRPVWRYDAPAAHVHPFGQRWAGLLKPGLSSSAKSGETCPLAEVIGGE